MKTISLVALFTTLVSALFLHFGTQPIPGALQIIGDRKTEQDIRTFEQRRQLQVYAGFALLVISAVAQGVVLYRDPRPWGLTPKRANPRGRKEGEDNMEQKGQEDDRMARERIRYQWMLDSVSKARLFFAGLVFAILSFSVQFSVPTANRAVKGCQLAAWILLLLTGTLSVRDAGGFVTKNMENVFEGLTPSTRWRMWACFVLAIVLLMSARVLSDWAT